MKQYLVIFLSTLYHLNPVCSGIFLQCESASNCVSPIKSPSRSSLANWPGYEGEFCQIDTNECASSPCLNNGECIDKTNAFHCQCPTGEAAVPLRRGEEGEGVGPGGTEADLALSRSLLLSNTNTHTHKHWSGRALIPALRRAYAGPGSPAHTQQLRRSGKRKSIRKGLRKFEVFEQVCYPFYQVWWSSRN